MSYYNYHQNIAYPDEPLFWVRIGGLLFTGDIHQVHEDFVFQEKYWDSYTEQEENTHFWIDPENPDWLYFNIVVTPSEISDLVEKTAIFGEVDAKEYVLEHQRSEED